MNYLLPTFFSGTYITIIGITLITIFIDTDTLYLSITITFNVTLHGCNIYMRFIIIAFICFNEVIIT